jgi:uncharacterized protein (TIGR02145 family)
MNTFKLFGLLLLTSVKLNFAYSQVKTTQQAKEDVILSKSITGQYFLDGGIYTMDGIDFSASRIIVTLEYDEKLKSFTCWTASQNLQRTEGIEVNGINLSNSFEYKNIKEYSSTGKYISQIGTREIKFIWNNKKLNSMSKALIENISGDTLLVFSNGMKFKRMYKFVNGKVEKVVVIPNLKIGTQVWMTQNLNVDRFRNGDLIPRAYSVVDWKLALNNKQPAWCYYDNDSENGEKYGKLYNWYAVNDPRGLAPAGWHIPSDDEWTALTDYLGGNEIAGSKLKAKLSNEKNNVEENNSQLSHLLGGLCDETGRMELMGIRGFWWSSTHVNNNAWIRALVYNENKIIRFSNSPNRGFSVLCIKDMDK